MTGINPGFGQWGVGSEFVTYESELYWGADQSRQGLLWQSAVISGAARDAGNTGNTTVLRPGLLLGRITASKLYVQWDTGASDGSEVLAGWLDVEVDVQPNGVNADRNIRVAVARGNLRVSKLLVKGAAFVGNADETAARRALHKAFCCLDDDPMATQVVYTYPP